MGAASSLTLIAAGFVAVTAPAAQATGCDSLATTIPTTAGAAGFGGGTGSVGDPWLLCSRTQLEGIDDNAATLAGNYAMTADIDLAAPDWTPLEGVNFTGLIDGNYFAIKNMTVSGDRLRYGLFDVLGAGTIKRIAILDSTINSTSTATNISVDAASPTTGYLPAAGLLAGSARDASVSEVLIHGGVIGGDLYHAGSLFGENSGSGSSLNASLIKVTDTTVTSTSTYGALSGIGGVLGIGRINLNRISVTDTVTLTSRAGASTWMGGMVGATRGGLRPTITQSHSGVVLNPVNTGNVGGFVGADASEDEISNSYFDGTINTAFSPSRIGGSSAYSTVAPTNFLTLSAIPATNASFGPVNGQGLTAATAAPSVFYDSDLNSAFTPANEFGTAKTSSELKQLATYADPSWKIASTDSAAATVDWSMTDANAPIWKIEEGVTYPELIWMDFFDAQFMQLSYTPSEVVIYDDESFVSDSVLPTTRPATSFSKVAGPAAISVDSTTGQVTNSGLVSGNSYLVEVGATQASRGLSAKVFIGISVSDETLPNPPTSIDAAKGPRVGETIWASAYERNLSDDLTTDSSVLEEYVYRITTEENVDSSSVDSQSATGYTPLDATQQATWYAGMPAAYVFKWQAFVCLDNSSGPVFSEPTGLAVTYTSLEDIFTGTTIDADDNADFRKIESTLGNSQPKNLTAVGLDAGYEGIPVRGVWAADMVVTGISEVTASCTAPATFQAFDVVDENGNPLNQKSLDTSTIHVDIQGTPVELDPLGLTIGVTGVSLPDFNAALWGITTIQPATATGSVPYLGPTVTSVQDAAPGQQVRVSGNTLSTVTKVEIDGVAIDVAGPTATGFSFTLPTTITPGVKDLKLTSSFGILTVQDAFTVLGSIPNQNTGGQWTKLQTNNSVKVYAKEPVGRGKIQFFVNGREVAWIRAADFSDRKLSFASGSAYLVRTIDLKPGKNRFEIKVNGERAWFATYVPKG